MTVLAALLVCCASLLIAGGQRVGAPRLRLVGARSRAGAAPETRPAGSMRSAVVNGVAAGAAAAGAGALPLAATLIAAAVFGGCLAATARRRTCEQRAAAAAVPAACRALATQFRAGTLPADALVAAASGSPEPLGRVLRTAGAAERLGTSAASALAAAPAGCEALRAVAVCWQVCLGSGAALAETADRLASVFAADLETRELVAAELAGVRLSALVMAGLPVFGLALGAALGADPVRFLIGTPAGRTALVAAAMLDAGGLCWVRALAVRAAR